MSREQFLQHNTDTSVFDYNGNNEVNWSSMEILAKWLETALLFSLQRRPLPFNLSVVADNLKLLSPNFKISKTPFCSFLSLCSHFAKEGQLLEMKYGICPIKKMRTGVFVSKVYSHHQCAAPSHLLARVAEPQIKHILEPMIFSNDDDAPFKTSCTLSDSPAQSNKECWTEVLLGRGKHIESALSNNADAPHHTQQPTLANGLSKPGHNPWLSGNAITKTAAVSSGPFLSNRESSFEHTVAARSGVNPVALSPDDHLPAYSGTPSDEAAFRSPCSMFSNSSQWMPSKRSAVDAPSGIGQHGRAPYSLNFTGSFSEHATGPALSPDLSFTAPVCPPWSSAHPLNNPRHSDPDHGQLQSQPRAAQHTSMHSGSHQNAAFTWQSVLQQQRMPQLMATGSHTQRGGHAHYHDSTVVSSGATADRNNNKGSARINYESKSQQKEVRLHAGDTHVAWSRSGASAAAAYTGFQGDYNDDMLHSILQDILEPDA
ncbi:hypothetical protein CYMTET_49369 [Cymbomonas tetramitiformis]|uniref:Uncharacterized protein n=1 Tax=Cymbomonas tetramitiformis TaxID=36881 RepID=A0AAE0EUS7_9CHLO|nr:hypothetical protein CYMTET_49369 [Cymbomonas tetramitiformis]